jgi:hypothetical protein
MTLYLPELDSAPGGIGGAPVKRKNPEHSLRRNDSIFDSLREAVLFNFYLDAYCDLFLIWFRW